MLTVVILLLSTWISSGEKRYDGYALIDLFTTTEDHVNYVRSLESGPSGSFLSADTEQQNQSIDEVQVWTEGAIDGWMTILVSPASKEKLLRNVQAEGITYKVKNENLQKAIDKEKRPFATRFLSSQDDTDSFFREFQPLDKIHSFMHMLEKQYPNIVKIEEIGKSVMGRPIYIAKVGKNSSSKNSSGIWIDGGIHSREWIAISTVTYILHKIVTGHTEDKIRNLVENLNWYILPVWNVDGYEHTHNHDRMWRLNRRPKNCSACCEGVDLNRNFDFQFGSGADAPKECGDQYPGPSEFSEPESQAVRDFLLKHAGKIDAFFDIHSYGNLWFYPYATEKKYPADIDQLKAVSEGAVAALHAVRSTTFKLGTPPEILYAAPGNVMDWAKEKAKIKYSYALELGEGMNAGGFVADNKEIIPTGDEVWASIQYVAEVVMKGSQG